VAESHGHPLVSKSATQDHWEEKEKLFCKPCGHGKSCHIAVWKVHVMSCLAHELSHLKLRCNQCIQARKREHDVVTCVYEWFKNIR
jgi:hypothetical protein